MSVLSYPFHSLLLKLPNKGMSFSFPPLKLLNKGREEYSKMILFIPFHSIPFPPPKRSLKCRSLCKWQDKLPPSTIGVHLPMPDSKPTSIVRSSKVAMRRVSEWWSVTIKVKSLAPYLCVSPPSNSSWSRSTRMSPSCFVCKGTVSSWGSFLGWFVDRYQRPCRW